MVGGTDLEAPGNRGAHTPGRRGRAPGARIQCQRGRDGRCSLQTFFPETTDIYDKKNMPRVVYCLHALR